MTFGIVLALVSSAGLATGLFLHVFAPSFMGQGIASADAKQDTPSRADGPRTNGDAPSAQPPLSVTNSPGSIIAPVGGTNTAINHEPEAAIPRKLSEHQKQVILAALAAARSATLFIPTHNSKESQLYSLQFSKLFEQKDWKLMNLLSGTFRPEPSAKILIGWRGKKTESYFAVVRGLSEAGIEFSESEFTLSGDQSADVIAFDVGVIAMTDYQIAIDRVQ